MKKILHWLAIIVITPVLLLFCTLTGCSLLGITINLDSLRPMIEATATDALKRKVVITGDVKLRPSLNPSLEVQGLRIDNPADWGSSDFVAVNLARMQIRLPNLIQKKIRLNEITAEGVTIFLESRKDDQNNWSFASSELDKEVAEKSNSSISFKAVDKLLLKDIRVTFKDTVLGQIDNTPVNISIKGMPLADYIGEPRKLPAQISLTAAGTELSFSGTMDLPVDSKTFNLAMSLKGEKLNSLNDLLNIDLPPFGPYSLKAQFAAPP